ncbi:unnamed protein product [Lota lota]
MNPNPYPEQHPADSRVPRQANTKSRANLNRDTVGARMRLAEFLILFVSANSALSLETVAVRSGQDVLLPCLCDADPPPGPGVSVFWRGPDDAHLYDIMAGRADSASQDGRFRGRVDSFPERYAAGNFSVLLRAARPADTARYACHIPSLGFRQDVELRVTGQEADETSGAAGRTRGHAAALHFDPALPLLLGPSVFLLWRN